MKLIACPVCHTQYDVERLETAAITCRCGESLATATPAAVDAPIARCGSCGAHVTSETRACEYCGSEIARDPAKLSLICPECFAGNTDASRFCVACGVAFRPEQPPRQGRELPCPACQASMPPSQVGGIALNECPSCRGLWVPGDHFDALVRRAVRARDERSPGAEPPRYERGNPTTQRVVYRRCPECEAQMLRVNFRRSSGVILDACRAHGTWLDSDELEQVAGFILQGSRGAARAAAEADHWRGQAARAARRSQVAPERLGRPSSTRRTHTSSGPGRGLLALLTDLID